MAFELGRRLFVGVFRSGARNILVYFAASVVLTSIQLSTSQFEDLLFDDNSSNDSNLTLACQLIDNRTECSKLPAVCLTCEFFPSSPLPECVYGEDTNFTCSPLEYINCTVSL